MGEKIKLWDAINRYVVACGGDPSTHVQGNVPRMEAVVEVEGVVFPQSGGLDDHLI